MSLFAIIEGLDNLVIDWAFVKITDEASPLVGEGEHNVWRGHLLQSLLSAHGYLVNDDTADAMLRCMFQIIGKQEVHGAASNASFEPAALMCMDILWRTIEGNTDVTLFERFAAWWTTNTSSSQSQKSFHLAKLNLVHPKAPTEVTALEYLRGWDGHTDYSKHREHMNQFMQRTFDVASKNNNAKGAAWMKERFQDRLDSETGRFAPLTKRELAYRRVEHAQEIRNQQTRRPTTENCPLIRYY